MFGKKKKEVKIPFIPDFMPHKQHVKVHDFSELRKKKKDNKIFDSKTIDNILLTILFVLLLIVIGSYFSYPKLIKDPFCGDGTFYQRCSPNKPYFCESGALIEKASTCGCLEDMETRGEHCASKYQTDPKNIDLKYTLRGDEHNMRFLVYGGLVDYISNLSKSLSSNNGVAPTRRDFKLRDINDPRQRELLLPLVIQIQNSAKSKEDQLRIAISLVQNIPFGGSDKLVDFRGINVTYSRYPYEVLYDMEGVCGERAELLAFLLKEMGYEVVFFYHKPENHESLGVRCPTEYSLNNTGYCFIETTGPSIITDNEIVYVGGITLDSEPEIIHISEGEPLPADLYEYENAEDWKAIRTKIQEVGAINGLELIKKKLLTKKYGLVKSYRAD